MYEWIGTLTVAIPALPLAAAIVTGLIGSRLQARSERSFVVALPTIIALVVACICSLALVAEIRSLQKQTNAPDRSIQHVVTLWTWAAVPEALETGDAETGISESRDFHVDIALRADALTATMLAMVTFISTLVAIYAAGYMAGDRGYWRFFAYIGLFVFSMTMLVSVSNFVLLFVFWEAVGVCSYLLIGFWYEKPEAAAAGKKAFLVNRVGDFGFALALFMIWIHYGTLNFHDTATVAIDGQTQVVAVTESNRAIIDGQQADIQHGVLQLDSAQYIGGGVGLAICLLLMLGACGKSAQFPLHVWLPDAMEGPTPVSALIHAATMVTAGVYMVTRCTPLFMVSPTAQLVVASIGGFTALLAGLIALTQWDLKRVLAYSTISQLGYMFLALGVGTMAGISAGMFHLFTHAFFKALLFLGSGSVMHAMGNVIDMRQFGGLRKLMPYTHATFLVGCLALAGVFPLAGFWSKDGIVASVHDRVHELEHELEQRHEHPVSAVDAVEGDVGHASPLAGLADEQLAQYAWVYHLLYYGAMFTAFLTAFYTFRAFLLTFYGEEKTPSAAGSHAHESPLSMTGPLIALAVCAALAGLALDQTAAPDYLRGDAPPHRFADFLGSTPQLHDGLVAATPALDKFHVDVAGRSTLVAFIGIALALYLYLGEARQIESIHGLMKFNWLSRYTDEQTRQASIAWVESRKRALGLSLLGVGALLVLSRPLGAMLGDGTLGGLLLSAAKLLPLWLDWCIALIGLWLALPPAQDVADRQGFAAGLLASIATMVALIAALPLL
ncbi:MAG: NADH-quinone oxidoreductase subunit L, partial [Pirellulaceae bacterium]|nr:NADH-quinone oxidoreductase subunit L [Pirellulaceae bacterium]